MWENALGVLDRCRWDLDKSSRRECGKCEDARALDRRCIWLAGFPEVLLSWNAVSSPKWAVLAGPGAPLFNKWRPRPGVQSVVRGSTGVGREPMAACVAQKQRPKAPFVAVSGNPCVLVELISMAHPWARMDRWSRMLRGPPVASSHVPAIRSHFRKTIASKFTTQTRLGYLPRWPLLQTGALKHGEKLETVLEAKPEPAACSHCPTFLTAGNAHPTYPKYVLSNPTSRVLGAFPANSHHTITLSTQDASRTATNAEPGR